MFGLFRRNSILLADNHGPISGRDQNSPNLGLLYLASYVNSKMDGINFTYIPQKYDLDYHIKKIEEINPEIYGLSFTSFSAESAYDTINTIRKKFPKLLIIIGGAHPTAVPKDTMENCDADICVIGEGEVTFLEIINKFNNIHTELHSIQGIAFLGNGIYKQTLPRPLIQDLDSIPLPDRSLVKDDDYTGIVLRKGTPNTEMIITRGCPYRCVFCANPVFLRNDPSFRKRSPKLIAEEAELLYRMGYKEIYLHSDELNINLEWSIELCKELVALGHSDLYFQCSFRVEPMSEELAKWMKEANFWLIRVGIESSSERVLKGIKKHITIEKTIETIKLLSKYDMKVFGYFMLFQIWQNGTLQHETVKEVNQTIKFANKIFFKKWLYYISWRVTIPTQGAELYDIALHNNLIDKKFFPTVEWDPSKYFDDISHKQYARAMFKGRILQGLMYIRNGGVEWKNWRAIIKKFMKV